MALASAPDTGNESYDGFMQGTIVRQDEIMARFALNHMIETYKNICLSSSQKKCYM